MGRFKHSEEQDCADAVVEQRLAGKLRADRRGDTDAVQHLQHSHGVSR